MGRPLRVFVVGAGGTEVLDVPEGVEIAYDLLTFDGMSPDKAADIAVAAHRGGTDPVAMARKLIRLRKAARGG